MPGSRTAVVAGEIHGRSPKSSPVPWPVVSVVSSNPASAAHTLQRA